MGLERALFRSAGERTLSQLCRRQVRPTPGHAVTGAFNRITIRGVGGQALKDKWADGPRTYLGIQSVGFPNLFTLVGPHNGATFCNIPRCSEQNVEWVTDCIRYMREHNHARIEAKLEAEGARTEHVGDTIANSLLLEADSWFMGANTPGKKRTFLMYAGGSPAYRKKCEEVATNGYEGFVLQQDDGHKGQDAWRWWQLALRLRSPEASPEVSVEMPSRVQPKAYKNVLRTYNP